MRVAVTGGAGFIGSHLADALISEGYDTLVIDDLSFGRKENLNAKAHFIRKDIRSDLGREFRGIDTVFHLAADPDVRSNAANPSRSVSVNVRGTLSVLESCRKADVLRFVFASSSAVYGEAPVIPTPESHPCDPLSEYGAAKLACEGHIEAFSSRYGIKATIMRPANVYGERCMRGVMHDFFMKLRKNPKKLEILGDGTQERSFLHVSDCVSAFHCAWKGQAAQFDVFNAGTDDSVRVDALARAMCGLMGISPRFSSSRSGMGWKGDIRKTMLDSGRLRKIGWRGGSPFGEGLGRYIQWLHQRGRLR